MNWISAGRYLLIRNRSIYKGIGAAASLPKRDSAIRTLSENRK
jgi:hypothetical protein